MTDKSAVYDTLYSPNAKASTVSSARVQFVIKASKLCNLRCSYCYEYDRLADPASLSHEALLGFYVRLNSAYSEMEFPVSIEFDWHGGEPLLRPPSFYWKTFDDQLRVFDGRRVTVSNFVQTNLYRIDSEIIRLLREGFDGVGVSLDLFGGQRRTIGGADANPRVIQNMERLREAGVPFGCIVVLSRHNRERLRSIFHFFERASISFRILPQFSAETGAQNVSAPLQPAEVRDALIELFEAWVESGVPFVVEPIYSYVEHIISSYASKPIGRYNKADWESIYVVDTDGHIYSYADLYRPELAHGKIDQFDLRAAQGSGAWSRTVRAADQRMTAACSGCKHWARTCSGYPAAEEPNAFQGTWGEMVSCVRDAGVLDHIERRLLEMGVIDPVQGVLYSQRDYLPQYERSLRSGLL